MKKFWDWQSMAEREKAMLRNKRSLEHKKGLKKLYAGVALALLLSASFAGTFYLVKKLVVVSDVILSGNQHLKSEELIALMRIRRGDELFGVTNRELQMRLMKSPWVKEAAVRKDLTGQVAVRIAEAVPRAVLAFETRSYLVDRDGVLLEELKDVPTIFLPVIRGIKPAQMRDTYREALLFIEVIHAKRGGLAANGTFSVTGTRPEDITLHLENIVIKVGSGDFERKLDDLRFVTEEIAKRNIRVEYVDLRFANRIVVKPANQETREPGEQEKKSSRDKNKKR
ncbi:MAG TPA: FtsQ-type POTRA domain-containing protein [Dissulfurispiraceae bacterium]|nr:FtsQ-type POTRA domain-containing protein [Dissulfurispiraceae bacterium]